MRKKDHPNVCLSYMIYCLTIGKTFNLAYYIAKRIESMTNSNAMTLPYEMPLTRLFKHVQTSHPIAITDLYNLVDYVMIPFSKARVFRIMLNGKKPHPQTLTESSESQSQSPTPHQEEENDLVSNYTLDNIVYIDQIPYIQGGFAVQFPLTSTKTGAAGSLCSKSSSIEPMEPRTPVLQ
nr:hypothetical protein [Tanacetum cinerariifolium]